MSGTNAERTVTARIDTAAMNKVTRFFNASTDAIIGEMLQNARRAGATEVRITTHDNQITIEDDGMGIGDPQQLLEFGASGWNDERSKAEDPAGMGFFSLARRNATVESWTEAGAGWRMELTPAHFTGEAVANVCPPPGRTAERERGSRSRTDANTGPGCRTGSGRRRGTTR